jgi:uncharacterized protein
LTEHAATVIIGEKVRPGCEDAFVSWQEELNGAASHYAGFIGAEITSPTPEQSRWSVTYRFDSIPNLQAWINSATRAHLLAEKHRYCDGPATHQIIRGEAAPPDTLITTVVTHRVPPGDIAEFLDWQERLRLAEKKFPGYRGSEMFKPVEGEQDEWTMLYRYNTPADLDRWLTSKERRQLLHEGDKFSDFQMRTIDSSFGNWFAFGEKGVQVPPPSDAKTVIAVWVGLYPTVMLLALAFAPAGMPVWLDRVFSTLAGSFVMTFITMPVYVNPLLRRWLYPAPDTPKAATNIRAALLITAVMVLWAVLFWLVTTVIWKVF